MLYSLKQAADAVGRGKPAILRAIQRGIISAQRNAKNEWLIDPAELHRVYPPIAGNDAASVHVERGAAGEATGATATLLAKIEGLEAMLNRERETVHDLRRRLDQSEEERRETQGKLTALLTHQPKPEPASATNQGKGGLLEKLFGSR